MEYRGIWCKNKENYPKKQFAINFSCALYDYLVSLQPESQTYYIMRQKLSTCAKPIASIAMPNAVTQTIF